MTLQSIVTSLELSRKLAEAGFEQEDGLAYWNHNKINGFIALTYGHRYNESEFTKEYRVFTFNELWSLLPKKIEISGREYSLDLKQETIRYREYPLFDGHSIIGSQAIETTLHEVAAELLLWCKKERYIDVVE